MALDSALLPVSCAIGVSVFEILTGEWVQGTDNWEQARLFIYVTKYSFVYVLLLRV